MKLLIINGPNLNLLGAREPQIYGQTALEAVLADLRGRFPQVEILHEQSNYEGRIIDLIQQAKVQGISGIVLNPGGYSHSSVAIADAIMAVDTPVVEVHISNIFAREDFRQRHVTAMGARGFIAGFGVEGYALAIQSLLK